MSIESNRINNSIGEMLTCFAVKVMSSYEGSSEDRVAGYMGVVEAAMRIRHESRVLLLPKNAANMFPAVWIPIP